MDILLCILKIYPDWRGVVWGNSYEGIKPHVLEDRPTPTLAELEAVWPEVKLDIWLDTEIRPKRNSLLDDVDLKYCNAELWADMNQAQKTAWKTYKQALRDLPGTIDPVNPVWPTMPTSSKTA